MKIWNKFRLLVGVVVALSLFPTGLALAQGPVDLPPGIAAQAEPLLQAMQQHMQDMNMSPEQMQMMMADMQALADQLPPGIYLQILELMVELDMPAMMTLHQAIQSGALVEQPPWQILVFVQGLA